MSFIYKSKKPPVKAVNLSCKKVAVVLLVLKVYINVLNMLLTYDKYNVNAKKSKILKKWYLK